MSLAKQKTLTIAVVGNPNTGKSTLFSALAGVRQRVGNYPGVTVEKKIGRAKLGEQAVDLVDLPGTYSLAPRSPDEMVAVDVLLGRRDDVHPPDGILSIVDASNLERNLYLVSQILELGLPTVVALNMVDVARDRGIEIDVERLQRKLGVRVVAVQANRRVGVAALRSALAEVLTGPCEPPQSPFPHQFQLEVAQLQSALALDERWATLPRYLVERLLLDTGGYLQGTLLKGAGEPLLEHLQKARQRLSQAGLPVPAVEAMARYEWVGRVLDGVIVRTSQRIVTAGDRLDKVLTHKLWGMLVFAVLMLAMFSSVFVAAEPLMRVIDSAVGTFGQAAENALPSGALRSLLVDGVIAGVGSVLVFLPQIMILFLFIAVLEDCGYMARAAYLMDKVMVRVGLSGKSFIPLLSSFACAVPGIMSARVIENRRDRLTTILVAPLMSCSARLPVYTILIGAFIPRQSFLGGLVQLQGLTLLAMYLIGMFTAAIVALVLKKTALRGATPPFVLELPSYKWPGPLIVLERILDRSGAFVRRAGTLILAVAIVVWAASYYPHDSAQIEAPFAARLATIDTSLENVARGSRDEAELQSQQAEIENEIAAAYQRQSILGRLGRAIEPVVRPLGWDWRIGCAAIASFPAREVVMGALGVIYNLGNKLDSREEVDQNRLQAKLRAATWDGGSQKVYNIPVALSIMVFFALCAQCASTLAVIKRETNTWRWPVFTFVYMTTLAYLGALATYQIGMFLGAG